MEAEQWKKVIDAYDTPLYLFDLDVLRNGVNRFRDALGSDIGLCYAMKANPFLVRYMEEDTDRIEICSMGEFLICKELNVKPEKMLISGVMKKKEDLRNIVEYCGSASIYTVESRTQFQFLEELSREYNKEIHVYLRLSSGNQFGLDESAWIDLISAQDVHIKIDGIHYFSGTQKKSVKVIQKELEYLDSFLEKVREQYGFEIEELEYGPGIAVPYFEGREEESFTDEGIREIAQRIHEMKWKGHITLEMGRALAAMCGFYLTKIEDIKQTEGMNYCIVDGGCHQMNYDGQIRGMYHPLLHVIPERDIENEKLWTVCGSLCTANDILCKNVMLQELKLGDVLVFERTGAYSMTEGMALFLSHELPNIVLYSEKENYRLVRNQVPTYQWNKEKENRDGDFIRNFK